MSSPKMSREKFRGSIGNYNMIGAPPAVAI
jgi:hypothetical protein